MTPALERPACNGSRFRPEEADGHYESWFQRANHPSRPLAFWIRYTIFRPSGARAQATGELWAIFFDGEQHRIVAVKEDVPIADCSFDRSRLDVRIGSCSLDESSLSGSASWQNSRISWSLSYRSPEPALLLLPERLYSGGFPKAKALVGSPAALFDGTIEVDGHAVVLDGWKGSQNHNWGSRHTDSYAWGQVAGFDDEPDAFLECATGQIRIGPAWSPRMSFVVLRLRGEEIRLGGLASAIRARSHIGFFDWRIDSMSSDLRVALRVHAPREAFVGLTYRNPPGGTKTCLNSKLASCEVRIERLGYPTETLRTRHRAAFEILTDRVDHGVSLVV